MKEKIIEMLGHGIPGVAIAATVGCDPSYVSQIGDEAKEEIELALALNAAEVIARDKKIEDIEDLALDRIKRMLPACTDMMKAAQVFKIMNSANKGSSVSRGVGNTAPTVELTVPVTVAMELKITGDNQIVEVDGRSMVPLPSAMVAKKLAEKRAARLLEPPKQQIGLDSSSLIISKRTKSIVDTL